MNTNGISSLLVNHAWTGNEGVNTDPGWHGVAERPHTPPLLHRSHTLHQSGGIGMFLSHIEPEKCSIPEGDNASNPRYHDEWEVVLLQ